MRRQFMHRQSAGFSLIEVLVALTILALATGSLLGIFSAAARNASVAMQMQQALAVAENQMALLDGIGNYQPRIEEGMYDDRFHWTVQIEAVLSNDRVVRILHPMQVSVGVDWQDGARRRSLALQTTRLSRTL
jgi:general secretion pathway protein I